MRRILIALVSLAAAGLIAELGLRLIEPRSADEIATEWRAMLDNMGASLDVEEGVDDFAANFGKRVPHPFTAFDLKNSARRLTRDVESFGAGELDDSFVILITGGSVAGLFGKHGATRLAERIAASGVTQGEPVEVLNYGRSAFKQPQQLSLLGFVLCLGIEPDLVINMDGFNELAMGSLNSEQGVHPAYPSAPFWAHLVSGHSSSDEAETLQAELWSTRAQVRREVESALAADVQAAGFARMRFEQRLKRAYSRWVEAQASYLDVLASADALGGARGPSFQQALTLELSVDTWSLASLSMKGLCDAHGSRYLHVLQPTLCDPLAGKQLTQAEQQFLQLGSEYDVGPIKAGYDQLREHGAALGAAGVPFLDATRVFEGVGETLYTDFCHFNEAGNQLLAELVAQRVVYELGG